MKKYDWSKNKLEKAIKNSTCYSDTLRYLNIPICGNNAVTLKKKIKEFGIDISHFTFRSDNKSKSMEKPIEEYLVKNIKIQPYKLKQKLFNFGLKINKCEICGCSSWMGKEINCQLHHIDGDNTNNELSNLQILCPNCHSQTDNYCGNANINPIKNYCIDCGRLLKCSKSKYCTSCSAKHRKIIDWENNQLKLKELVKTKTNVEIGKIYGVSEATIRKYRKKFNI